LQYLNQKKIAKTISIFFAQTYNIILF